MEHKLHWDQSLIFPKLLNSPEFVSGSTGLFFGNSYKTLVAYFFVSVRFRQFYFDVPLTVTPCML